MKNLCIIKSNHPLQYEEVGLIKPALQEVGENTNTQFLLLDFECDILYVAKDIKEATIRKIDEEGNITVEYKEKE